MAVGTLYTGIFPPIPPPILTKGTQPESTDSQVFATQSSLSTIPPPTTKLHFFAHLKERHLALNCLPDVISPPSREPSPDFEERVKEKREMIADLSKRNIFLGDRVQLMCTRLRGTALNIRKEVPGADPTAIRRRAPTPPLVDTEEEWQRWVEESSKATQRVVLEEVDMETQPVEGRVERWRHQIVVNNTQDFVAPNTSVAGSTNDRPSIRAPSPESQPRAGPSREPQQALAFRVVKRADTGEKSGSQLTVGPPRGANFIDDIYVPQSQPRDLPREQLTPNGVVPAQSVSSLLIELWACC
jgi:hypothetical protein